MWIPYIMIDPCNQSHAMRVAASTTVTYVCIMVLQFNLNQLQDMTQRFWQYVSGAKVFAFHGEMGAGKTTVITALCRQLGVKGVIGSPTYSIINEYVYPGDDSNRSMYHIDLYRLKNEQEVVQAGVEDCISGGWICMVEWPDRAPGLFDNDTVHVYIKALNETDRLLEVK